MSTPVHQPVPGSGASPARRAAAVGAVALAAAALVAGAATATPTPVPPPDPVDTTGRTVAVCPAAPVVNIVSTSRGGELAIRPVGAERATPLPAGQGATQAATEPLLVVAEGRQSTGSAGSSFLSAASGQDRGLALARCVAPGTSSWFTGLYASGQATGGRATLRSEVILTNTDATRADVDLRLLGPNGAVTAAGARGLTVPARSSRVVALEGLVADKGPLGVQVRASRGRIHATVRQRAAYGSVPGGTDLQVPSTNPATQQVVPGVPGVPGERTLVLTNPGDRRTTAKVEVLGRTGTFAPVDAGQVDVNAGATVQVSLTRGLAQEAAAVRVTTDQPVVAAMVAQASDDPATGDVAVQPAAEPLGPTAIGALAVDRGVAGAVIVTNAGSADTVVSLHLVGVDGRELKTGELPVRAGATAQWEVAQVDVPAGVVVRTPRGATTYAGLVLTSVAGPGLASSPLSVPEQASGGPEPQHAPGLGGGR